VPHLPVDSPFGTTITAISLRAYEDQAHLPKSVQHLHDVNRHGTIVGALHMEHEPGHFRPVHAFSWTRDGSPSDLHESAGYPDFEVWDEHPTRVTSTATGIHASGSIVGSFHFEQDGFLPFLGECELQISRALLDMTPIYFGSAADINASGHVVGAAIPPRIVDWAGPGVAQIIPKQQDNAVLWNGTELINILEPAIDHASRRSQSTSRARFLAARTSTLTSGTFCGKTECSQALAGSIRRPSTTKDTLSAGGTANTLVSMTQLFGPAVTLSCWLRCPGTT
jgi:hypothetical protein